MLRSFVKCKSYIGGGRGICQKHLYSPIMTNPPKALYMKNNIIARRLLMTYKEEYQLTLA